MNTIAIQLGRLGDLVNILPACRHLGVGRVMCCEEFLPALRGQSYVDPVVWPGSQQDTAGAIRHAHTLADRVVVPQMDGNGRGSQPPRTRPSYVQDQWDRLEPGFGDRWGEFPLVYDLRRPDKESALVESLKRSGNPILLVNLKSCSSPFDAYAGPWRMDATWRHLAGWGDRFEVLDIQHLRLECVCDMLGLFEAAVGLVVADTMPLHLARAVPGLRSFQFVRPDKDATPVRDAWQPHAYQGMDKIDSFLDSLYN